MLSTIVVTSALKGAIGLVGTGLWLVPLLIAGLSYYHYDQLGEIPTQRFSIIVNVKSFLSTPMIYGIL